MRAPSPAETTGIAMHNAPEKEIGTRNGMRGLAAAEKAKSKLKNECKINFAFGRGDRARNARFRNELRNARLRRRMVHDDYEECN